MAVPTAALVIWGITLLLIALVIVPLAVALLQRTLTAARSIEAYLVRIHKRCFVSWLARWEDGR